MDRKESLRELYVISVHRQRGPVVGRKERFVIIYVQVDESIW